MFILCLQNIKRKRLVRQAKMQNLAFVCCQLNQQFIGGSEISDVEHPGTPRSNPFSSLLLRPMGTVSV